MLSFSHRRGFFAQGDRATLCANERPTSLYRFPRRFAAGHPLADNSSRLLTSLACDFLCRFVVGSDAYHKTAPSKCILDDEGAFDDAFLGAIDEFNFVERRSMVAASESAKSGTANTDTALPRKNANNLNSAVADDCKAECRGAGSGDTTFAGGASVSQCHEKVHLWSKDCVQRQFFTIKERQHVLVHYEHACLHGRELEHARTSNSTANAQSSFLAPATTESKGLLMTDAGECNDTSRTRQTERKFPARERESAESPGTAKLGGSENSAVSTGGSTNIALGTAAAAETAPNGSDVHEKIMVELMTAFREMRKRGQPENVAAQVETRCAERRERESKLKQAEEKERACRAAAAVNSRSATYTSMIERARALDAERTAAAASARATNRGKENGAPFAPGSLRPLKKNDAKKGPVCEKKTLCNTNRYSALSCFSEEFDNANEIYEKDGKNECDTNDGDVEKDDDEETLSTLRDNNWRKTRVLRKPVFSKSTLPTSGSLAAENKKKGQKPLITSTQKGGGSGCGGQRAANNVNEDEDDDETNDKDENDGWSGSLSSLSSLSSFSSSSLSSSQSLSYRSSSSSSLSDMSCSAATLSANPDACDASEDAGGVENVESSDDGDGGSDHDRNVACHDSANLGDATQKIAQSTQANAAANENNEKTQEKQRSWADVVRESPPLTENATPRQHDEKSFSGSNKNETLKPLPKEDGKEEENISGCATHGQPLNLTLESNETGAAVKSGGTEGENANENVDSAEGTSAQKVEPERRHTCLEYLVPVFESTDTLEFVEKFESEYVFAWGDASTHVSSTSAAVFGGAGGGAQGHVQKSSGSAAGSTRSERMHERIHIYQRRTAPKSYYFGLYKVPTVQYHLIGTIEVVF